MRKLILFFILLGCFFDSNAQLKRIEVGASPNVSFFGKNVSTTGFGTNISISAYFVEKAGINANYTYYFPINKTETELNTTTTVKTKISFINLNLIVHLLNDYDDNYSLYVPLGVSLVMGDNLKIIKNPNFESRLEEKINDYTANLGVGYQFSIGNPKIYTEIGIGIPPGAYNRNQVLNDNNAPFSTTLKLGIKFPIEINKKPNIFKDY